MMQLANTIDKKCASSVLVDACARGHMHTQQVR
jgi:hypothetical protein